jgi:hypothetical protein
MGSGVCEVGELNHGAYWVPITTTMFKVVTFAILGWRRIRWPGLTCPPESSPVEM